MKKCLKCGQTYDDSWKVCLHCSISLTDDPSIKESRHEAAQKSGKKKPDGIMVFGVLIIIGSVFSLLSAREGWKYNPVVSNYLYLIVLPLAIVAAVFLLKLKNWARIVIIAISVIVLVETIITVPHVLAVAKKYAISGFDKISFADLEKNRQRTRPDSPKLTEEQTEAVVQKIKQVAEKAILWVFKILITLSAIFNCLVIYYFSLPRVKEQFRRP